MLQIWYYPWYLNNYYLLNYKYKKKTKTYKSKTTSNTEQVLYLDQERNQAGENLSFYPMREEGLHNPWKNKEGSYINVHQWPKVG